MNVLITGSSGQIGTNVALALLERGDHVEAYVSMDFDIPSLSILEDKLRRSNALLENLLLSAVDCVVAADMSGKIFLFNQSSIELFGYSRSGTSRMKSAGSVKFGLIEEIFY